MKCHYCQGDFEPSEKPYISKQASMEGEYHWSCFVEACKNRMPVGIGAINVPNLSGNDDESKFDRAAATMEE
jgi:hypothetical protein